MLFIFRFYFSLARFLAPKIWCFCFNSINDAQVASVKPWYDSKPETIFKQHFNICMFFFLTTRSQILAQFVLEQPFTKNGKPQGDIKEQYMRRTIFSVECPYPSIKYRLKVAKKEWVFNLSRTFRCPFLYRCPGYDRKPCLLPLAFLITLTSHSTI
jgi:hypothetical protein